MKTLYQLVKEAKRAYNEKVETPNAQTRLNFAGSVGAVRTRIFVDGSNDRARILTGMILKASKNKTSDGKHKSIRRKERVFTLLDIMLEIPITKNILFTKEEGD